MPGLFRMAWSSAACAAGDADRAELATEPAVELEQHRAEGVRSVDGLEIVNIVNDYS